MDILFLVLLFIVAWLYSSVGHGGASGYLAIMAIFGISPDLMRSSAFFLNIFVAGAAAIMYIKGGYFKWKIFLPFAICSVPMAFVGAQITIDPKIYKIILGIFLLLGAARILYRPKKNEFSERKINWIAASFIGASIGLLSGIIGIGGGIILSPILLLFHWANFKETAAASAVFIVLNSVSGLFGLYIKGFPSNPELFLWVAIAVVGGFLGSWGGSTKYSGGFLKYVLSTVIVIASFKLFLV